MIRWARVPLAYVSSNVILFQSPVLALFPKEESIHMCLDIRLPQIDLGSICEHPISQSMHGPTGINELKIHIRHGMGMGVFIGAVPKMHTQMRIFWTAPRPQS